MEHPREDDAPGRPLTQRDLDHTPDDGNLYEVVDGVLYVTPFPTYAHQHAVGRLHTILDTHVTRHDLGEVLPPGLKVVLDDPTGVGPDLVFIAKARMSGMRADGYYGAPDLLVEVLSSRPMLDRHVKFHKYARSGVPHYWIVDPEKRQVGAYRLEADRYALEVELGGDAVFAPALFPGLAVPLAALWTP